MSIKQLEQRTGVPKGFTLRTLTASALREAAYREDRTMSDIVDTALTEWLVRFGYMSVDPDLTTDESSIGDIND